MQKKCNKIIFLDFDGVIRLEQKHMPYSSGGMFYTQLIKSIVRFAQEEHAKIVISSDWRKYHDKKEICELLSIKPAILHEDWQTPQFKERWNEILTWKRRHPEVDKIVILDDIKSHFEKGCKKIKRKVVLTDPDIGITEENLKSASRKINNPFDKRDKRRAI